jgi:transcription elongation factor GreA
VRKGKISIASPIARALIGKTIGTTVEVDAPRGAKTYKILKVDWLGHHPKD